MYLHVHITWKTLFKDSSRDHASLSHLLCRLGRLPEAKVPKKNLHACLYAHLTIYKGHLITAACMEPGLDSPDSVRPSSATGQVCLADRSRKVVTQCTVIPEAILRQPVKESEDGVYIYARVLCHLDALVSEFTDAWSEGDGERILRRWKIFMLHFHADS